MEKWKVVHTNPNMNFDEPYMRVEMEAADSCGKVLISAR